MTSHSPLVSLPMQLSVSAPHCSVCCPDTLLGLLVCCGAAILPFNALCGCLWARLAQRTTNKPLLVCYSYAGMRLPQRMAPRKEVLLLLL